MIYLDTSALIKRFVREAGSQAVSRIVAREPVATSKIAYVEVHATLMRARREGRLTANQYTLVFGQFEREWPAYIRVDLNDDVLRLGREMVRRHPLRGYDAVHLASAVSLGRGLEEQIVFVAADARLLTAAAGERLETLDVRED
jgi:predicted nucleic acid-binding protein